jgi:alcohol dehydrogenase class IV
MTEFRQEVIVSYWFENPLLKPFLPMAVSTSVKGLSSRFVAPRIFFGANLFPEGPSLMPTPVSIIKRRCPRQRAFLVTDPVAEKHAGRVAGALERDGFATQTWNQTKPEAPLENVKAAARAMTEFEPDLIMTVGGGSVMDLGKAAWVLYERRDLEDLTAHLPIVPLGLRQRAIFVAVPTTSGTGSECTNIAVVTDEQTHRKVPIVSGELTPDFALLVPEFTASMPPGLTVGTGLDVLAHAVDSAMLPTSNELTDALALGAVEMVFRWLPRAFRNGNDREARARMLLASSMAGMAISNAGVSLTHAFGHSVGARFGLHHGLCVGLFIPYCLQFYLPVSDRWLMLARALDVQGRTEQSRFNKLIKRFQALYAELDAPWKLRDLGVERKDLARNMKRLVRDTMADLSVHMSPRPLSASQCEKVLRHAHAGKKIDF